MKRAMGNPNGRKLLLLGDGPGAGVRGLVGQRDRPADRQPGRRSRRIATSLTAGCTRTMAMIARRAAWLWGTYWYEQGIEHDRARDAIAAVFQCCGLAIELQEFGDEGST